jgi:hypothetical protein
VNLEVEMAALDLEMFTNGAHEPERAQVDIGAALSSITAAFRKNRLYPGLGDLIELGSTLETIRTNRNQYQSVLPRKLAGVDFETKTLKFESVPAGPEVIERMFALVDWALPMMHAVTEEGVAMFDFVTQNLSVDVVGIMPMYRDEGYALIPDIRANLMHVLRYEMSLYAGDGDKYRALKTVELEPRALTPTKGSPEDIKIALVKDHTDLPNPATYFMNTDLDFPFEETILPVAKRKLMRHLIS